MDERRQLLTASETARILKLSVSSLHKLVRSGRMPPNCWTDKLGPRKRRFSIEAIHEWLTAPDAAFFEIGGDSNHALQTRKDLALPDQTERQDLEKIHRANEQAPRRTGSRKIREPNPMAEEAARRISDILAGCPA